MLNEFARFALRPGHPSPVYINDEPIPNSDTAKYTGLKFDKRLTWAKHVRTTQINDSIFSNHNMVFNSGAPPKKLTLKKSKYFNQKFSD